MKPGSGCLFKAIEGLSELTHMKGKLGVSKPLGLFHEYFFGQNPMQKSIGHVKLLEWLVEVEGYS
jgi:hypothetical protein